MPSDNERFRLNSLNLYRILDTSAEQAFDDLTKLASVICGTPISLVSLVDEDRQWFKSRHGLEAEQTPRDQAFCNYAIQQPELMVVEDANEDVRFRDNPLVTGEPNIRFYAGAPLTVANGESLGTLCVIDVEPRTLTASQIEALGVLRDAVVTLLEYRRAASELEALQDIVPMCAWCRNIKLESSDHSAPQWQALHEYVAGLVPLTHGICPDCKHNMSQATD